MGWDGESQFGTQGLIVTGWVAPAMQAGASGEAQRACIADAQTGKRKMGSRGFSGNCSKTEQTDEAWAKKGPGSPNDEAARFKPVKGHLGHFLRALN